MKKIIPIFLCLSLLTALILQIDFQRFGKRGACAFCDQSVLESQVFYRGEGALGLLTHKPAVKGHVLITPERHVERFEDLTSDEMRAIGETIKKVDAAVRKTFGNTDYILVQKNGRKAGQTVPHVHFHYLPARNFLAVKFLLSPWFKPLDAEELKLLKEDLSELF